MSLAHPSSEDSSSMDQAEVRARLHPFRRILGMSRFPIFIAIIGLVVNAIGLLLYGAINTYRVIVQVAGGGEAQMSAKQLMLACIEITDLFLLAAILYVIAMGLYELFIDATIRLPPWLIITNIDDLKHKLISVVITILGVTFLGQVIAWDGGSSLQPLGIAIGIVVAALTYFLSSKGEAQKRSESM